MRCLSFCRLAVGRLVEGSRQEVDKLFPSLQETKQSLPSWKMPCQARHDIPKGRLNSLPNCHSALDALSSFPIEWIMAYKTYFVYILSNYSKTVFYTGVTNDLESRVWAHKEKFDPKSFTARYQVNLLMWYETHNSIDEAIHREKLIKKWKRKWKFDLIEKNNPEWKDLSANWYD